MHYLIFGILLIVGAAFVGFSVYRYHSRNKITATVVESRSDVKKNGEYIEDIRIVHMLAFDDVDKKTVETEVLPVRELKDAELEVYFDKNTQSFYVPDYSKYLRLISAFVVCGIACLAIYILKRLNFSVLFSETELLALFLSVIAVVSCSHLCTIIHPAVVKAKGNFEAVYKPAGRNEEAEIYCLWYGEHRQYAKRTKGMRLKVNSEKTVTLFFNTKTGVVFRLPEFVLSMCVSAAAFAAMILILIV